MQAAIEALLVQHKLPGILIAVAAGAGKPQFITLGSDEAGLPFGPDTLFPVASVTKLATTLAVLRLVATGAVGLDDELALHLPDAAAAVPGVTVRRLLSHTSGLPNDVAGEAAPYALGLTPPVLTAACLGTSLVRPPGMHVGYSNVDFGLLAALVEGRTGLPFPAALAALVLAPLGIEGYLGDEPPRPPARVGGRLGDHQGTPLEPFNSRFWRSLALPWAGLVTTVGGALALVRAFLPGTGDFLPDALRHEATTDQTGGLAGGFTGVVEWDPCPWGLGAELLEHKQPHMVPPAASPRSFGHSGYSGCLAWADPDRATPVSYAILGGPRGFSSWARFWHPLGLLLLERTSDSPQE